MKKKAQSETGKVGDELNNFVKEVGKVLSPVMDVLVTPAEKIEAFLLILWQLPQYLVSLVFWLVMILSKNVLYTEKVFKSRVVVLKRPGMGVSFGLVIFISIQMRTDFILAHEYGHSKQSVILGPLYLIVVGIPGIIRYMVYDRLLKRAETKEEFEVIYKKYHKGYPERWSNLLVGIEDVNITMKNTEMQNSS